MSGPTPARLPTITAVILAGSRGSEDPVARHAGVSHKCLAPVGGEPMISRVVGAVAASAAIDRLAVVIEQASLLDGVPIVDRLARTSRLTSIAAAASPVRSVLAAREALDAPVPLLITTADHALLTTELIEQFLAACDACPAADVVVAVASADRLRTRYPEAERTAFRFAGERYSGCNLFLIRTLAGYRLVDFWRSVEEDRKKPWRLVRRFGWRPLIAYLLGRLSLQKAMDEASRVVGVRVDAVVLDTIEAAIDVDKLADLELVERIVAGARRVRAAFGGTRRVSDAVFRIAHLSDPHVPSRLDLRVRDILSKRLLGYLSWTLKRRRLHRSQVLDAITHDIQAQRPDQIVVTGDIVNIALPSEFVAAADWLARLGPADRVTVIPGNHDTYVREPWARTLGLWQAYMACDEDAWPGRAPGYPFPFVRRRGPVALVGLSTAIPTGIGLATGVLGKRQVEAARDLLRELGKEGLLRIVLVHHPPSIEYRHRRKWLSDAEALRLIIGEVGAELILHGHTHRFSMTEVAGPEGPVTIIGTPSASMISHTGKSPSQYHVYGIEPSRDGWELTVTLRRLGQAGGRFLTVGEHRLLLRRGHRVSGTGPPLRQGGGGE